MEKIIFCADLHGNLGQYQKTLDHARKVKANLVVFGGDLTPKDPALRTPLGQRDFFEQGLFPILRDFKKDSDIDILFIMGNDDFRSNRDLFIDGQARYGYQLIDETPYISKAGYIFIGYSHVPFTPFKYKCWERRDRAQDRDFTHRGDTRTDGVISRGEDLVPYDLHDALEKPSIAEDLEKLTAGLDPTKLVLVSHAPPYGTVCDFNSQKKHVGSKAVRDFVDRVQPYMTLHGHIHETVDLMGDFKEQRGRSTCVAVGNDHRPADPYVIEIDLGPEPVLKRLQLSA